MQLNDVALHTKVIFAWIRFSFTTIFFLWMNRIHKCWYTRCLWPNIQMYTTTNADFFCCCCCVCVVTKHNTNTWCYWPDGIAYGNILCSCNKHRHWCCIYCATHITFDYAPLGHIYYISVVVIWLFFLLSK